MLEIKKSKIDYVFENKGFKKTFIAVHGFGSYHQKMTTLLKDSVVEKGYNYLAFSLPGHGLSVTSIENMTFKHICEVLVGIVEQFNLERITLFGHSLGGGVVLASAVKLIKRLEKVIVVGTISRSSPAHKQLLATSFFPEDLDGLKRLANIIYYYGEHVLLNEAARNQALAELDFLKSDPQRGERLKHLAADMLANPAIEDQIDSGIKAITNLQLAYGEGDGVVTKDISDYFKNLNSNTVVTILQHAGHSPWEENKEGFFTWFNGAI